VNATEPDLHQPVALVDGVHRLLPLAANDRVDDEISGKRIAEPPPLDLFAGLTAARAETLILEELGESALESREVVVAAVFNAGFSDTGPDGVSLFNTAHPLVGPSGGTQTNRSVAGIAQSSATQASSRGCRSRCHCRVAYGDSCVRPGSPIPISTHGPQVSIQSASHRFSKTQECAA